MNYPVNIADLFTNLCLVCFLVCWFGGGVLAGVVTATYRWELKALWTGVAIGLMERLFFIVGVAFWLPGIGVAMIAWITAKMAAGWNKTESNSEGFKAEKRRRFASLAGGIVSMLAATIGGLICGGHIIW